MASPTSSRFVNNNDYVLPVSEHLQCDVSESPFAQVLSPLHETASQQIDEAEKERKDAERAMEDLYATNRSKELLFTDCDNALPSITKLFSSDPNEIFIPMKSRSGGLCLNVPIKVNSSCKNILEFVSKTLCVDVSLITIINTELPGGCLNIDNCDLLDDFINRNDTTTQKLFELGNTRFCVGSLVRSTEISSSATACPLVVSDIKKALNAARQDPNYFVVKFRPLTGGQLFEVPIKKGSSCYDILNSLSTYFEVDISKVCIVSSEIPDANRKLTIENCDVVDQAIRSTNKSIQKFFVKMSVPTFRFKD